METVKCIIALTLESNFWRCDSVANFGCCGMTLPLSHSPSVQKSFNFGRVSTA